MSTILKSLKKLEEEKSLLEKNLDLQDLLVHESGDSNYLSKEKVKRWMWLLGFVSGGIVLGIFLIFWGLPKLENLPTNEFALAPMKPIIKKIPKTLSSKPIYNGIAMSSIQDQQIGSSLKNPPVKEIPPLEDKEIQKSPPIMEKVLETSTKEETELTQIVQESPESDPVALEENPLQKPNHTITAAVPPVESEPIQIEEAEAIEEEIDVELNEAIEKAKKMIPVEEEIFPNMEVDSSLPDFQLRGIIFFGENNPSNYIFYSTSSERNQKLRVGENVLGATLKQIDPERAIFSHQGRKAILEIGK